MATHSSVLAWRIPGMGEPGGLPSMGSHRVGHDSSDLAATAAAGDLPNPGIKPVSLKSLALAGRFFTTSATGEAQYSHAAAAAKSLQSCLTLCDPMDCSLPGFSVLGILQARILEWVTISLSRGSGSNLGLPHWRQML